MANAAAELLWRGHEDEVLPGRVALGLHSICAEISDMVDQVAVEMEAVAGSKG